MSLVPTERVQCATRSMGRLSFARMSLKALFGAVIAGIDA